MEKYKKIQKTTHPNSPYTKTGRKLYHNDRRLSRNHSRVPEWNFTNELHILPNNSNNETLKYKVIRKEEIFTIIKKLKNNKTPGYDLITLKMLKKIPAKAVRFLTILLNAIYRVGNFLQIWKCAEIILLQKPGKNPKFPSSYMLVDWTDKYTSWR